jgi:hypothetical protein
MYLAPTTGNVFIAQSGIITPNIRSAEVVSRECTGEQILSIKQLISRSTFWRSFPTGEAFTTVSCPPFYRNLNTLDSGNNTGLVVQDGTYSAYFTSCYGFGRGSTVFDIMPQNPNVRNTFSIQNANYPYGFGFASTSSIEELGQALHVVIPYFQNNNRSTIAYSDTSFTPSPFFGVWACRGVNATSINSYATYRAGDDAQLGLFLGCPPLTIGYSTPASNDLDYTTCQIADVKLT